MSRMTMAMAFAVMMGAGMAVASAQTAATTAPLRVQITTNHLPAGQLRVSEMTGAAVYDNRNEKFGSIKDIVLDRDGHVAVVVLDVSGPLGVGGRYVAIGIGDLKITTADGKPRFTVDMLKDQLKTAQTYDLNEAKLPGASVPPPPADDRPPPADRER